MAEFFVSQFSIWVGVALFVLMIPALWRVWEGPTAIDRIVGVNIIGTKTAVLLIVIGTVFGGMHKDSGGVEMFVDFAL
ncbi:MAG: hypothetical protein HKN23_22245, partial [Verrucomicrobiales bacterium]|nr:hypothetical protein [Verrucomicrobiales bacterium]